MNGWILVFTGCPKGQVNYCGPYSTEYGAEAARKRLIQFGHKFKVKDRGKKPVFVSQFQASDFAIEQVG